MIGQRIGYVRVSTLDQSTGRQLDGVQLDRVFEDKASGKDMDRPELKEMIKFAREGDTVVVHSMDRLARNLEDLRSIVRQLTAKQVRVEFVKEQLAFTGEDNAMANLLLNVNVPNRPVDQLKPIRVCRLGRRHSAEKVITQDSPRGATEDVGKYLTVWKKVDGKWQVAVDAANSDRPCQ